jgi:hypothetical protein
MARLKNGNIWLQYNTESLSNAKTLTNTDKQYQFLNPNGSDRIILLPAVSGSGGLEFTIANIAVLNNLIITHNSNILTTIKPGMVTKFICNNSMWATQNSSEGSGGIAYTLISTNTIAVKNYGYLINASNNNVTLTLPASPTTGDTIGVVDAYNKATTNIISIDKNSNNIEGLSEDLILDINGSGFIFVYIDTSIGWKIVSEIGSYKPVNTDSLVWSIITNNTTAAPSKGYLVNASSNNVTILLPTTPVTGDAIGVCDVYRKALTNVITIDGNGYKIKGVLENLIIDIVGSGFVIVYVDSTRGWEIVSETGLTTETLLSTTITDGDITHAPDGNSVFDALALKAPISGATLTSATINALTLTSLTTGFTIAGGTTSKTLTVDETVALSAKAPNLLTGYTSGAGTVASTDTVLQAIQKLNGNFEAGNYAYGVRWDTSQSSPILTKGIVVNGVFITSNYTQYPIQSQMKRCVKNTSGTKVYNLTSTNSIYKENQTTPLFTGTVTRISAGLIEIASTTGVAVGHWVHNTTTNIASQVTIVTSSTRLTLALDIFATGNAYSIGTANPQADGAVMVEVPATQYIMCANGTLRYFLISEGSFNFKKSDGTIITSDYHPWFYEGGVFRAYQYWGAFESVWWDATATATYKNHDGTTIYDTGDKAVSMPGFQPMTYQDRPGFRTLHSNFGSSYHTESYYADEFMSLLFITEYGTFNSQIALPGYTEGTWLWANVRTTGRTMHLGNTSGTIAGVSGFDPGTYNIANSYRGIENCYGHVWKWLDGINFNSQRIYINNNPGTWVDGVDTNYTDTGLYLPASGYQMLLHTGLMLPSTIGADSATYITDYAYSVAGWLALLSGGGLHNGALAGVFCRGAIYAGSYRIATLGSRSSAV